jgi:hypothetical protein
VKKANQKKKSASGVKRKKRAQVNLDEVWPDERDFMERPNRIKYARKLIKSKGCVFCEVENLRRHPLILLLLPASGPPDPPCFSRTRRANPTV